MRILYLCHRIPYPPDKGDKIRSFHQVEYLGRRHEVDLFTLVDDQADLAHVAALRGLVRSVTVERLSPLRARARSCAALLRGEALSVAYFRNRRLLRAVRAALATGRHDLAFVFSSAMAPYLGDAALPRAIDFVDLDSEKWLSYAAAAGRGPAGWLWRREGNAIRVLEKRLAETAELTVLCSPKEVADLVRFARPRQVACVPNGTDVDAFAPAAGESAAALPGPAPPEIVFVGAMDYKANADAICWFAAAVLPLVRQRHPEARLAVVGSNPTRAVLALGALPGVEVTGRVADVRPWLHGARLALAPLRVARGIQNKVLEALASGVPVVATPAALSGIRAGDEPVPGVLVGASPPELAAAVSGLLEDRAAAARLGREGRRFVVDRFCWSARLAELETLLLAVAGGR